MEIIANIPDSLANSVKRCAEGKDFNESLITALKEWVSWHKIKELNSEVEANPIEFTPAFSSESVRNLNRAR